MPVAVAAPRECAAKIGAHFTFALAAARRRQWELATSHSSASSCASWCARVSFSSPARAPLAASLLTPRLSRASQAEEELIEIVPTFSEGTVAALTGDLGPFTAGIPVVRARLCVRARAAAAGALCSPPLVHPPRRAQVVPLWAALRLKADQRCRVVPPHWLTLDFLRRARAEERERADAFAALPFYYVEISRLLLSSWCGGAAARRAQAGGLAMTATHANRRALRPCAPSPPPLPLLGLARTSPTPTQSRRPSKTFRRCAKKRCSAAWRRCCRWRQRARRRAWWI